MANDTGDVPATLLDAVAELPTGWRLFFSPKRACLWLAFGEDPPLADVSEWIDRLRAIRGIRDVRSDEYGPTSFELDEWTELSPRETLEFSHFVANRIAGRRPPDAAQRVRQQINLAHDAAGRLAGKQFDSVDEQGKEEMRKNAELFWLDLSTAEKIRIMTEHRTAARYGSAEKDKTKNYRALGDRNLG
jgi:hypothetical protein